jgi:ATP-dependent 26S proteasome regulatory subunit
MIKTKNGNGKAKKEADHEDVHWDEYAGVQRRSLYSNVIIVESDDRRRLDEMFNEMKAMANRTPGKEKWFALDPWNGLMEVIPKTTAEGTPSGYVYKKVEEVDVKTMGFEAALPMVSEMLTKGNMVLTISNILKTNDQLNTALIGWSGDDQILHGDSTILVFVSNRYIFPTEVWTKFSIVTPPKSTVAERMNLLKDQETGLAEGSRQPIDDLTDEEMESVVRLTAGLNLDQIEAAAIEAIQTKFKLDIDLIASIKKKRLGGDAIVEIIQQPKFGFEAVGGYKHLKERIRNDIITPLKDPDLAEYFNVRLPRGIILYGPPGCGKSLFVKSMAKELDMTVLLFHIENVLGKYVGESEKSMRRVFDIADALAPCILFVDEIDKLGRRSSTDTTGSNVDKQIFSMLLEKLGDENRAWFFAAATNIIEVIDPAMRRTGRIDSVIPIPFPDEAARKQIFEIHTKVRRHPPIDWKTMDLDKIAKATYMWSGSDIENLVDRTCRYALQDAKEKNIDKRKVTMDDFEKILDTYIIPVTDNIKFQNNMMKQAEKFTNDKRLLDVFEQEAQKEIQTGRTSKAAEMMKA